MGFLRLFFALSILITHSAPLLDYTFVNAELAVKSFFILSGFYMALILSEKYVDKKMGYWLFISNRFLRIFPLYWVVLIAMVLFALTKFIISPGEPNAISHLLEYAPHATSLEYVLFFAQFIIRNITLIITPDYLKPVDAFPGYLFVQQAWTLQVELLFYLSAPFLVRLNKKVFSAVFLAFVILYYGIIFPMKLINIHTLLAAFLETFIFFLLGILAFRTYQHLRKLTIKRSYLYTITALLFLITTLGEYLLITFRGLESGAINLIYFVLLFLSLPFIFIYTARSRLDKFLGQLSYPVYISHFLVIKFLSNIIGEKSNFMPYLAILLTFVVSFIAIRLIEEPINNFRQKRLKQGRGVIKK